MARRKQEEEGGGGAPAWMATYGDLVTLLMCFFVLLFATSSVDAEKFKAIAESFNSNITFIQGGGATGVNNMVGSGIADLPKLDRSINDSNDAKKKEQDELNKKASDFKTYFAENEKASDVQVEVGENYVKITFGDGILFDSGKAELKNDSYELLEMIAEVLEGYPTSDIKIEGHTDNIPIRSAIYQDNMYLSAARSISVLNYFKDVYEYDPARLSQEGFGEYRPIANNETPEGRAKNRRVEIKVMSQDASTN